MEDLRKPVHALVEQRFQRLGCDVAPGEAGAARGDDGIDAGIGTPQFDGHLDGFDIVCDDLSIGERVAGSFDAFGQGLAGAVVLKAARVGHMSYVPDAGHSTLIRLFNKDPDVVTNVLTTEEEGVAIAAGSWLGGIRSVLLMQSSGVGNCINMLSLPVQARFPFLTLVTMRGEWAEFNPWQVPMGKATHAALEAIGLTVLRAETGAW